VDFIDDTWEGMGTCGGKVVKSAPRFYSVRDVFQRRIALRNNRLEEENRKRV